MPPAPAAEAPDARLQARLQALSAALDLERL